ncbi:hypothetical protein ACVWXU_002435 [Streptomyces sp. TE33382]
MAQPATGPPEGPCSAPPTASGSTVHPVGEELLPPRPVPAALRDIAAMHAGPVTPPLITGGATTPCSSTLRHPRPQRRGTQILLGSCRARIADERRRKHHGSFGRP